MQYVVLTLLLTVYALFYLCLMANKMMMMMMTQIKVALSRTTVYYSTEGQSKLRGILLVLSYSLLFLIVRLLF